MKIYNLILLLFLCYLLPVNSKAQEISIFGRFSLYHAYNLCDISLTGCDWRTINEGNIIGYGYHPSGALWAVLVKYEGNGFSKLNIFNLNIKNCQYLFVNSMLLPKNWNCLDGINIDYLGRLYLTMSEYDSITHKTMFSLSRINDPLNPTIERLTYLPLSLHFWELHFQNDKEYMVDLQHPYIHVFDNNFVLIDTIITTKHIMGLTSFSFGCDSIKTYATNMNYSTEEYLNTHPDSVMHISEYNLETNTLTPICDYDMANPIIVLATSPLEFLSSDPECELLIDLDRDNSTGVYPYDYYDSTSYCTAQDILLADQDLYIHTSAPLDSVRLTIRQILDLGLEALTASNLPPGFNFITRNDSTYVLINSGAPDAQYRDALLSIRYHHLTGQRTPGPRKIIVQGFNAVKDGKKITATVHLHAIPYAGMDASLLLCRDTIINNLSSLTLGQAGGTFQPTLSSGGNQFNSALDDKDLYAYVISDPVCGADTAIIHVVRDTSSQADLLGPDQKLCPGDSIVLSPVVGASSIVWDDGSTDLIRVLHADGEYWISTTTNGGCNFSDSLTITTAYAWPGIFTTTDPTCHLINGEIFIDSSAFIGASQVIFNGNATNGPHKQNLGPGIYTVKVISNDDCVTQYNVELFDTPVIIVSMDSVITIPSGNWATILPAFLNNIRPVNVHTIPSENIKWTDPTLQVFGDHDTTYDITFEDENGCIDIKTLHVHVEQLKGLYLPNVFYPGSYNGNNTWTTTIYPPYELEVVRVYDRWGNMVYQSMDEIKWDGTLKGKECASGVYVYQVNLKNTSNNDSKTVMGDLTLIR